MPQMRISSRSALLVVALVCLLVPSSAIAAGAPAAVTVRVEGLNETKVPPTLVTTTTTPVVKDGDEADSCPGTSAAGALQLATAGNWSGTWFGEEVGYSVETIGGESHLFESGSKANYFWSFWLNDVFQTEHGVCGVEMTPGDQVLLFVECEGSECPPNPTPLGIEAPATANVGEAAAVTVKQYNAKGEASPAVGANIIGGGAGASTDSQGHATLKFFAAGTYTLRVSGAPTGPPAVRTETTICVHNGNDGTCGTTLSSAPIVSGGPGIVHVTPPPVDTPTIGGIKNGHHYARGKGPRILRGLVKVPAGGTLRDVRISLQRRSGKRCFAFNGTTEKFVRDRCGKTSFFSVGDSESFSYLLPSSLPKGRYVYDIEAINDAGSATKLVAGTSHVVFYVK